MTEKTGFEQFPLSKDTIKLLKEIGYESPSPIQVASIPPLLEGRDIIGQAQTGTGKTAAFSLPLLERINAKSKELQIMVLTPTRELAIQVAQAMQTYARYKKDFHVLAIYGGQDITRQLKKLKSGVQVVVGTPGRVMDHMRRKSLVLTGLKAIVLDEADEMLKMGFQEDIEWILSHTTSDRQTALFSATMPDPIRKIARTHLKDPVEIHIKATATTVSTIEQFYWETWGGHKQDVLIRILETEDADGIIIFARTRTATVELAEKLETRGYLCTALNGDISQAAREKTIQRMKKGDIDIIVATDVAARGLDIARITHVINYDIPQDTESYVHRIGRTGRAGKTGKAISLINSREFRMLKSIEKETKSTIQKLKIPTAREMSDKRVEKFKESISDAISNQKLDFFEELIESYAFEATQPPEKIAAALAYLLQKDKPLIVKEDKALQPPPPGSDRSRKKKPGRDHGREFRKGGKKGAPQAKGKKMVKAKPGKSKGKQKG